MPGGLEMVAPMPVGQIKVVQGMADPMVQGLEKVGRMRGVRVAIGREAAGLARGLGGRVEIGREAVCLARGLGGREVLGLARELGGPAMVVPVPERVSPGAQFGAAAGARSV
jgi:hypothetical protein